MNLVAQSHHLQTLSIFSIKPNASNAWSNGDDGDSNALGADDENSEDAPITAKLTYKELRDLNRRAAQRGNVNEPRQQQASAPSVVSPKAKVQRTNQYGDPID